MSEKVYAATATGFDQAATRYDAAEAGNVVLARMRAEHWRWFCRAFSPQARLLELGSGTGFDAARLAGRGNRIALVDVAGGMLERAAARVRDVDSTALLGQHHLPASAVGTLVESYGAASFDGAYSSFGPLNCEPQLAPVAAGLAQLIKPGGRLVFSIMPRLCLTEMLWFGIHGEWDNMTRRLRKTVMARALPGDASLVQTYYYSPPQVCKAFQPAFRQVRVQPLPLLWPPPYLAHLPRRLPRFFAAFGHADTWASKLPFLSTFGDHFLIEFERL